MSKKVSGLGKGLDELLEDNNPTARTNVKPLVVSKGEFTADAAKRRTSVDLYGSTTKTLYDTKPKTKSVKSNFKK